MDGSQEGLGWDGVTSGVVRGDSPGRPGRGLVDPGVGRRHGVHRRTVRQALASAEPPPRKSPVRSSRGWSRSRPRSTRCCGRISTLRASSVTPRRGSWTGSSTSTTRTGCRIRRCGTTSGSGARRSGRGGRRVRRSSRRPTPRARGRGRLRRGLGRPGRGADEVLPVHVPVVLLGQGGAPGLPTQAQEAFLEGHVDAFKALGGVPTRQIRYDNLTSAVRGDRVRAGRGENDRWVLFRSHYGFDAFYCQPGIEGAHEKGGVEGEVGRFRRNHLVPVPEVDTPGRAERPDPGLGRRGRRRRITGRSEHGRAGLRARTPLLRRCRTRGSIRGWC